MREVLSSKQFRAAGLDKLTATELANLDAIVTEIAVRLVTAMSVSTTSDVIESQIDGDFEGWDGETVFVLTNGQIWQQDSYDYTYHYAFMPGRAHIQEQHRVQNEGRWSA